MSRGFDIEIAIYGEILDIFVDGTLATSCSIESVAAEIERLVVKRVVPATPHLVTFHAAAVQRDGRQFPAGESGSGKTTRVLPSPGRVGISAQTKLYCYVATCD